MSAAHVHVADVSVRYRDRSALDRVDLLEQGGLLAVLGPNGAGKTTLVRCLATVLRPDAGSIRIDGLDPDRESERTEARRRIGYVPQEPGFHTDVSAFDVLDYFAVLKEHRNDRHRRRLVFGALDRVGLAERAGERVGSLSGGMRRRLAIAQALLGEPSLLLLDEPAAGLDPDERMRLRSILADGRQAATTIMSTHLTDEAAHCDTVIVLVDGSVRFTGTPDQLARVATGHTWVQHASPSPGVRANWRLADGRFRCLGAEPERPGSAEPVAPTIEDGYLLVRDRLPPPVGLG